MNDAQAVDLLGSVFFRLDAIVKGDDVGAGLELFAGHGLEQRQAHALLSRSGPRVDVEDCQAGVLLELGGEAAVLSCDQKPATFELTQNRLPVEVGFGQQKNSVRRQFGGQLTSGVQEDNGLTR